VNNDPKPEFLKAESARLKDAFLEGYAAGYNNGTSDQSSFEFGSGSKHKNTLDRDKQQAWRDSETHQMLHDS
jgi:hypothetical protein